MMEITKARDLVFRYQRMAFLGLGMALSIEELNQGLISPSHPHESSFAAIFILGFLMIRNPYYQHAEDYAQLIWKMTSSFIVIILATFTIEGSWDIVYVIKYYYSIHPYLVTGVQGGLELMVLSIALAMAFRFWKLFHMDRLLLTFALLFLYYEIWYIFLGFVTSGAPYFSSSLLIALVEIFHWIGGAYGFAWSLDPNKEQRENENL